MAIHTEYSLRHKVEFILDELAENPRLTAHKAIRIICAPNKYGIASKNEELNGMRAVSECECVCTLKTAAHIIRNSFNN